eukprot:scaffold11704_cov72-Phaeocystis_antarctica.AAC.6
MARATASSEQRGSALAASQLDELSANTRRQSRRVAERAHAVVDAGVSSDPSLRVEVRQRLVLVALIAAAPILVASLLTLLTLLTLLALFTLLTLVRLITVLGQHGQQQAAPLRLVRRERLQATLHRARERVAVSVPSLGGHSSGRSGDARTWFEVGAHEVGGMSYGVQVARSLNWFVLVTRIPNGMSMEHPFLENRIGGQAARRPTADRQIPSSNLGRSFLDPAFCRLVVVIVVFGLFRRRRVRRVRSVRRYRPFPLSSSSPFLGLPRSDAQ